MNDIPHYSQNYDQFNNDELRKRIDANQAESVAMEDVISNRLCKGLLPFLVEHGQWTYGSEYTLGVELPASQVHRITDEFKAEYYIHIPEIKGGFHNFDGEFSLTLTNESESIVELINRLGIKVDFGPAISTAQWSVDQVTRTLEEIKSMQAATSQP